MKSGKSEQKMTMQKSSRRPYFKAIKMATKPDLTLQDLQQQVCTREACLQLNLSPFQSLSCIMKTKIRQPGPAKQLICFQKEWTHVPFEKL